MNKEEKAEKKKQRGELKEETYNKYTDITNMLLEKGFYTGFHQTFTTFLAMSMCAEATKNNLMKIGADSKDIEQAREAAIREIWQLLDLYEKGTLQQLMKQHQQDHGSVQKT
jgi:hypothetical protein